MATGGLVFEVLGRLVAPSFTFWWFAFLTDLPKIEAVLLPFLQGSSLATDKPGRGFDQGRLRVEGDLPLHQKGYQ